MQLSFKETNASHSFNANTRICHFVQKNFDCYRDYLWFFILKVRQSKVCDINKLYCTHVSPC